MLSLDYLVIIARTLHPTKRKGTLFEVSLGYKFWIRRKLIKPPHSFKLKPMRSDE